MEERGRPLQAAVRRAGVDPVGRLTRWRVPGRRGHASSSGTRTDVVWFRDHYHDVPRQILDFLGGDGISLAGRRVADVGSGDGIIDLGLVHAAGPASLTGFDVDRTDSRRLLTAARAAGVAQELPENLRFERCDDRHIPAPDGDFDAVVSWSTFEHVADPAATAAEIRRILRPDGLLFLQLYPFFHSGPGSHLWDWFPDGFAQLRLDPAAVEAQVRAQPDRADAAWTEARLADFRSLNRVTVDGLQDALTGAGLLITKVELLTGAFHLPLDLPGYRITDLGITGIKLTAVRT